MAPPNPLAHWDRVGDSFYRKVPVYDVIFDEDVELENYIIAGAPYGGALGRFRCFFKDWTNGYVLIRNNSGIPR